MHETVQRPIASQVPRTQASEHCPECGEPIRGIESTQPDEHRFIGCGHAASDHFLRPAFADAPR